MSAKLARDQEPMSYQALLDKNRALEAEIQDMKVRLGEAEELKRAISEGDLDALVINTPEGELIFTLDSADRAYRVLVETMNEGTVTLACDGTILYCNRHFAELIKMPPHAIAGRSIYEFIAPEDAATFRSLLEQETGMGELRLRAEGGDIYVPAYLSISSLKTEGSPNSWCLVITDLTEQKKNEEILAAERLARSIIEQAAEAIIVCDVSGRITRLSNAVSKICRCDPTFQKFEDIIDIRFSGGEHAGKSVLPVSSALKGSSLLGVEAVLELKNGHESHLLLNCGPLKNDDGRIIGCVVTLADITELKQTEKELQESERQQQVLALSMESERARLASILENLPAGVWIADENGQLIGKNKEADRIWAGSAPLLESVEEYTQYTAWYTDSGKLLESEEYPVARALLTGQPVEPIELNILRFDGTEGVVLVSAAPIKNGQGRLTGVVGINLDITERKKTEDALHQAYEEIKTQSKELQVQAKKLQESNEALSQSQKRFRLLSETNALLLSSKDPKAVIQTIAENVAHNLNFDVFFNYVFDEIQGKLHLNAFGGINTEAAKKIEWLDKGAAICGCVAIDGYRIVSEDVQHSGDKRANFVKSIGIQAYACQPLHIGETTIGTLSFGTRSRKDFTGDELAFMSTVADQVSVAIERKRAEDVIKTIAINLARAEKLANLGHWDWDLITNHVKWSNGHFRIFGYAVAHGRETYEMWRARVHPEDLESVERVLREGMEKDMGYNWNYRLLMPDASVRYIHAEADRPVKDASGKPVRWFGIIQDITKQRLSEGALRESQAKLEEELEDTRILQNVSSELLHEDKIDALYGKILDAAMQIMHSEYASIQMFYTEHGSEGKLKLIASHGFNPQAAKFWEWVSVDSESSCGVSLHTGKRVIIPDIENFDFTAGSEDRTIYLQTGIRSCQTTPLLSRTGKLVGMISTHWRNPHEPSERDLQLFDILARQAADLIDRKQAEMALQESEEKYRSIVETANEGILIIDPEIEIKYVNRKMAEMLGYSQEEIIGRSMWNFIDKESKVTATKNIEEREQGIDGSHELKLISKSGLPVWTIVNAKSLFDKYGQFTGSMEMLTDITERKEAETKLRETLDNLENIVKDRTAKLEKAYSSLKESERGLAEAQKMAHIGNWKWDIATDKTDWSNEMYRIFGRNFRELAPSYNEFLNYIHPDDRDYVNSIIKKAINGKAYSTDFRIISDDGIERIVHKQSEIIFDEESIPIGLRGTVQDVTESKLAQQKLEQSEEKYRSFIQNLRGIAFQLDKDFNLKFIHGAVKEITGYTEEELVSQGWKQVILPEDLDLILKENKKLLSFDTCEGELDYRIKSKDGNIRWVHDIHQKVQRKDSDPIYNGIVYDITEKKETEEALEKMDKIRIKEIHHRIKNNLQVICSLLSLEAEKFEGEKVSEAFRESQNRVTSMALIHEELYRGNKNDALDFSKYLHNLTADLFSSYSVGNDNVSLEMDLEHIYLDMDTAIPLGIIVNELVSNSLKHAFPAESQGEIRINLRRTENFTSNYDIFCPYLKLMEERDFCYMLSVEDNGKGIPGEINILQTDSLGLQLVNILVEQIDGSIELRRGKGTKFFIFFNTQGNN